MTVYLFCANIYVLLFYPSTPNHTNFLTRKLIYTLPTLLLSDYPLWVSVVMILILFILASIPKFQVPALSQSVVTFCAPFTRWKPIHFRRLPMPVPCYLTITKALLSKFPPIPGGDPRNYASSGSSVLLQLDQNKANISWNHGLRGSTPWFIWACHTGELHASTYHVWKA